MNINVTIKNSRVLIVILSITASVLSVHGQDSQERDTGNEDIGLYAFGGIGPAIPVGNFGKERAVGFDLNTAVEYKLKSGLFLRGMFDFSSFTFEPGTISQESNGMIYEIGGSNNLVSLLGSAGYFCKVGKFSPYLFGGTGASFVSIPKIDIDEITNTIDTSLEVTPYLSLVSGAGVDFTIGGGSKGENKSEKKGIILYLEAFYTYIPTETITSTSKFSLVSINLGLKSKF